MDKTASLSFLQSVFINSLLTSSYPSQPHWFPTPIYSHITALYATVTNTRPRPNSHEEKREEHEIWKKTCGKRGRVFLVRPCISPTSLFLPGSLWLSGGWEWWVRWWRVTEVRKEREESRVKCVGLHVSWLSVADVSLALGKSESVSRLDMRSNSACTSLRPSLEPALSVNRITQSYRLGLYKNYQRCTIISSAHELIVAVQ